MALANPYGIPNLDREEPDLWIEEDIPTPSNDDPEQAEEATRIVARDE